MRTDNGSLRQPLENVKKLCIVRIMPTAELGPTGERVAENAKALRARVPVREMSQRLAKIGRPILPSGLTKIEQGSRRVDADDLVALALTLNVTPNRLLLPADASDTAIKLTDAVTATASEAWRWASGERPLTEAEPAKGLERGRQIHQLRQWRLENRPHDVRLDDFDFEEFEEHREQLARVSAAVADAKATGVPHGVVMRWLQIQDVNRRTELG